MGGSVLVGDDEVDYDAISKSCENGIGYARRKTMSFAPIYTWGGFEDGVCAISWTLYPDGRYFEDEDGFGGEKCHEEIIYAIIDTDLNFVEPFRPINDVDARLKEIREERRERHAKPTSLFSRLCGGRRLGSW